MVSESTAPGLNLQSGCNRVEFRFQVSGHRPLIQRATMPAKCLRAPMLGSFANSRPIGASFAQRSNAGVPKAGLKVMKVMGPKCGLKVERMGSYRCRENTNDADIVKDRNMGIVHPEPAPVLQSTGTCNHFPCIGLCAMRWRSCLLTIRCSRRSRNRKPKRKSGPGSELQSSTCRPTWPRVCARSTCAAISRGAAWPQSP